MVTLARNVVPPGKIYLELDAYELGQVVALLPDVAWNRMERELRNKFKAAQEEIAADRKPKPKRRKKASIEPTPPPDLPALGTPTEIVEDLRGNDSFNNLSPEPEQTPDENVDRNAIETPNPSDDDFFE